MRRSVIFSFLSKVLATACTATLLGPLAAFALSSDRDQNIEIEADRAEADDLERVTIYRGDVVIVQGTLRIEGDTVWIHYDENNEMTKLVSVGRQAHFRQLPDGAEDFRTAYADRLEYYNHKDLIIMLGDAKYGQGKDRIDANRIVYDTHLARMKADSGPPPVQTAGDTAPAAKTGGRVKIRIVPKRKQGSEGSPPSN